MIVWQILFGAAVFIAVLGSWRLIGRADRWSQRRSGKEMRSRQRNERPTPPLWVAQYWWALCAGGVALLGFGIALHRSPAEFGGPISLGVIFLLAGLGGWRRKRRDEVS